MNIHATFARCKKPDGCKMGKGKGAVKTFVARVPEGKAMFTIPRINQFPGVPADMYSLKIVGDLMPMPCRLREQNNSFNLSPNTGQQTTLSFRKFELKRTFVTTRTERVASRLTTLHVDKLFPTLCLPVGKEGFLSRFTGAATIPIMSNPYICRIYKF